MTVPYLLRFCSFRALMGMLFVFIPRVSLRLPWAMRSLGFQPVLPKSETHICCLYIVICCFYEFAKYILLRAVLLLHVKFPLLVFKVFNYRIKSRTT